MSEVRLCAQTKNFLSFINNSSALFGGENLVLNLKIISTGLFTNIYCHKWNTIDKQYNMAKLLFVINKWQY